MHNKILLAALPFWSPLIPAQGISVLKSFLQQYGYQVKTVDAAVNAEFMEYYKQYFNGIRKFVPIEKRGNFYNIGHDVLRNHMMAHINYNNEEEYTDLVKKLIYRTFYCQVDVRHILELNQVLDQLFAFLKKYFLRLLEEEKPFLLGLSVNSGNLPSSKYIFEITREYYPHVKTVMGGSIFFNHLAPGHPDLEYFLKKTKSYVDKVIIGKGEILLLKLLKKELPESQRVFSQEDLTEEDLESHKTDIPDLSDYNLDQYFYLAATGSYSCPFKCSFCNAQTFFGKYRKKDALQTVDEMRRLHYRYGHHLFFMTDSLLNPVITAITTEIIRVGIPLYIDGYFIVDQQTASIENTLLWRRGGFYRARLGVESGSQRVLDLIGKKITPEKIKAAVSSLAFAGIKTTTYWVIGHPGETEKDFQQTLDLLEELKDEIWQAECNPFTYYFLGQSKGYEWSGKRKLLYPDSARDMLISQTWYLDCKPCHEEIYNRVFRFVEHCKKLGIPNPYSADEIYKADERWKKLHKNAVPAVMDLINNQCGWDESRKIKQVMALQNKRKEEGDFGF
jgi:radical SAM superfamily enzyme YgiQ (UPF0313 family)